MAKENECKFLQSKVCSSRELVDNIHGHQAHREELEQEKTRISKQFESVSKLEAAEKNKIEDLQKQISKKQAVLKDISNNMDVDSVKTNYDAKLSDAKSANENLKTKLNEMKDNLARKKSFDSNLTSEMQRKHQERVKPLEKRVFAKKDELAGKSLSMNNQS